MIYTDYSIYEGEPARIYRLPSEIWRDISEIRNKIEQAERRFNIRSIVTDAITNLASGESLAWLSELRELVALAEDTLTELRELREELNALGLELKETEWLFRDGT